MPRTPREGIALVLAYDGGAFSGWQIQPGLRTIQGELRAVLARLHDVDERAIDLVGAGRTDAGVHAAGQVAAYHPPTLRDRGALLHALSRLLNEEIRVLQMSAVGPEFHPVHSCVGKTYGYRIERGRTLLPFDAPWSWHVPDRLDLERMRCAARRLVGRHDFAAFQSAGSPRTDTMRTLFDLQLKSGRGSSLEVRLRADGFLYRMARNIVGYLVAHGRGDPRVPDPDSVLAEADRSRIGKPAPARGLCLLEVIYPSRGHRGASPFVTGDPVATPPRC